MFLRLRNIKAKPDEHSTTTNPLDQNEKNGTFCNFSYKAKIKHSMNLKNLQKHISKMRHFKRWLKNILRINIAEDQFSEINRHYLYAVEIGSFI